jgi:hypothetical protein
MRGAWLFGPSGTTATPPGTGLFKSRLMLPSADAAADARANVRINTNREKRMVHP